MARSYSRGHQAPAGSFKLSPFYFSVLFLSSESFSRTPPADFGVSLGMVSLGDWTLGAPPAKMPGITENPSVIVGPGSSNRVLCFSCLPAPCSHSSQCRISGEEGFNSITKRGEPPI